MRTITRGLAVAAVLSGAAIGWAGPASAELLAGDYTATMINAGPTDRQEGSTATWAISPCGPDCMHVGGAGRPGWDLHRQGDTWTGSNTDSTAALDSNSLVFTLRLNSYPDNPVVIGLAKNG